MRLCSSSISSSSLLLLSFVLLLLLQCCTVEAQQNMPFAGNGEEPPEPTTVFVSTYIDRLMYIDDKNYEFQVGGGAVHCWLLLLALSPTQSAHGALPLPVVLHRPSSLCI